MFRLSLASIALGILSHACVSAPAGYQRVDNFGMCVRSDLELKTLGELSGPINASADIPTPVLRLEKDYQGAPASVRISMRPKSKWEDLNFSSYPNAKPDSYSGLFLDESLVREVRARRFYLDQKDHPSFVYSCFVDNSGATKFCSRLKNFDSIQVGIEASDIKQWAFYEAALDAIEREKLVISCK